MINFILSFVGLLCHINLVSSQSNEQAIQCDYQDALKPKYFA